MPLDPGVAALLDDLSDALGTTVAHDEASRGGFDTRSTVRAWTRTEGRRRLHADADYEILADLIGELRRALE